MTVFFFMLNLLIFWLLHCIFKNLQFIGQLMSTGAFPGVCPPLALGAFAPVLSLSRPHALRSSRELFPGLRCLPFMLEAFITYLVILSCLIIFKYEVPKKYLGLIGACWYLLEASAAWTDGEAFGEGGPSWQYLLAFPGGHSVGQRWILPWPFTVSGLQVFLCFALNNSFVFLGLVFWGLKPFFFKEFTLGGKVAQLHDFPPVDEMSLRLQLWGNIYNFLYKC